MKLRSGVKKIKKARAGSIQTIDDPSFRPAPVQRYLASTAKLAIENAANGIGALGDQALVSLTNFSTGLIIARACSRDQFGYYIIGFSILLLLENIQISIISTPYTVYSQRLKGKLHAIYSGSTLIHQLVFCLLSILVLALAGAFLTTGIGPAALGGVIWALAAAVPAIMLREYLRRYLFANFRMTEALFLDLSIAFLQISGLLILANLRLLSVVRAFLIVGLSCCISSVIWLIRVRREIILNRFQAIADFNKNFLFGKWVLADNIVAFLSRNLYPWLLMLFHGAAATGLFGACWGVVGLANPLLYGIGNFLGPRTALAQTISIKELRDVVVKTSVSLASIIGLFCIGIVAVGDKLITLLYGSKYIGNGQIMIALSFSILASAVSLAPGYGLAALERPDANFKINLISLVLALTLGLWMAKSYGPIGAAFGILGANIVASIIRFAIFSQFSLRTAKNRTIEIAL